MQETIRKVIHEPRLVKKCVLQWWNHYSLIKSYSTVDGRIEITNIKLVRLLWVYYELTKCPAPDGLMVEHYTSIAAEVMGLNPVQA